MDGTAVSLLRTWRRTAILTNTDQQQPNRDRATKKCNDVRGDYSGTSLQCDGNPFASTKERGADNLRYSARLIDAPDNEASERGA